MPKAMIQYFLKTSLGNQGQASKILFSLMMCLVLIISWAYREPVFFRDYAIIWEGVGDMAKILKESNAGIAIASFEEEDMQKGVSD